MNDSLITVRYVKALYQLSEEKKLQDAVEKDMELLLDCINNSKEFAELINNPLLKKSKKIQLINKLFEKKVQDLTLKFLHLLIKHKREIYLFNMCLFFIKYYKQRRGVKEAEITTAIPLKKSHKEEIMNYIQKKFKLKIELEEQINPAIIGGFMLRIEDQQINASIRSQLNKIKRELINS